MTPPKKRFYWLLALLGVGLPNQVRAINNSRGINHSQNIGSVFCITSRSCSSSRIFIAGFYLNSDELSVSQNCQITRGRWRNGPENLKSLPEKINRYEEFRHCSNGRRRKFGMTTGKPGISAAGVLLPAWIGTELTYGPPGEKMSTANYTRDFMANPIYFVSFATQIRTEFGMGVSMTEGSLASKTLETIHESDNTTIIGHPEPFKSKSESFRGILKERQTQIELSAVAVSLSLDGLTTIGGSHWHEINPVCRPFTRSNAGVAGYMALGFAGVIVSNRVLIHHPKLRHGLNWVVVGMEIGAVSFNRSH